MFEGQAGQARSGVVYEPAKGQYDSIAFSQRVSTVCTVRAVCVCVLPQAQKGALRFITVPTVSRDNVFKRIPLFLLLRVKPTVGSMPRSAVPSDSAASMDECQ